MEIMSARMVQILRFFPKPRVWRALCILLIAGGLAVLSISFPIYWFLAPFSIGLFFYVLWETRSLTGAVLYSFIYGGITGGAGIWWFWDTLPLNWLGLASGPNGWYFVFASWGPVTLAFAVATLLFAVPIWLLRTSPYKILAAALLWVLVEETRMWSFSLLTFAERSFYGPHFSAPSLGYALAENHYLLQIAQGGGIYFLNFAVALAGAFLASVLWWLAHEKHTRYAPEPVSALVLVILLLLPLTQRPATPLGESFDAVLVSTYLPVGWADIPTTEYQRLMTRVVQSFPTASFIVLPEEKRIEPTFSSLKEKQDFLYTLFGTRKVFIVSGIHEPGADRGYDATLTYETSSGEVLGSYTKRFLMPGGEYMPTIMGLGFSLRPDSGLGKYVSSLPQKIRPRGDLPATSFKGHQVGGLICSDFLSPHLYRELAIKQQADILINIANPAWFHGSRILFDKTVAVAKVHAVQNRAYYLQSTNGGPAFAINPEGVIIGMTDWNAEGIIQVHVQGAN